MAIIDLFTRTKRKIGSIKIDGVLEEAHQNSVKITQYPVEFGAEIADHAIIEPKVLTIKGIVTNTPNGFAGLSAAVNNAAGFFGSSGSQKTRAQLAYTELLELMEKRDLVEVQTGLTLYENLVITQFSANQDKDLANVLIFDMTLQEVILTESETVSLGAATVTTQKPTVQKGPVPTKTPTPTSNANQSLAKKLVNFVTGE